MLYVMVGGNQCLQHLPKCVAAIEVTDVLRLQSNLHECVVPMRIEAEH